MRLLTVLALLAACSEPEHVPLEGTGSAPAPALDSGHGGDGGDGGGDGDGGDGGDGGGDTGDPPQEPLSSLVSGGGAHAHLEALAAVADSAGGTRVAGSVGYDGSVSYVADQLEAAGYEVTLEPFDYSAYLVLGPTDLSITDGPAWSDADVSPLNYSPSGTASGALVAVDLDLPASTEPNSSTSGCEGSDFADFPEGAVALIQRGNCTFTEKASRAEAAGAVAVIIFNEGQEGRRDVVRGDLNEDAGHGIPIVGATHQIGLDLVAILDATPGAEASVTVDATVQNETSFNVLASTAAGDPARRLVVGAHLDSVAAGPGINDNGSGSAVVLETALVLAASGIEPSNQIQFAFWGAEESGLLGSFAHVDGLSGDELSQVLANLNFDMVASPNPARMIYDGDGSDAGEAGPPGSAEIEAVFTDWFEMQGQASAPTAFSGRSDYGPFIWAGIPAGGLFTGAESHKTPQQAEDFGGQAGEPLDACYHQACDGLENIDLAVLDDMARAAAHSVQSFGEWEGALGTNGPPPPPRPAPADRRSLGCHGHERGR